MRCSYRSEAEVKLAKGMTKWIGIKQDLII